MSDETFRKVLIYMLKNYKIYYINMFDELEEYKIKEEIDDELNIVNDNINQLRNLNIWSNAFVIDTNVPQVNYNILISQHMEEIAKLLEERKGNVVDIKDEYPLEKIAFELSKIGEKEDLNYYYKYSKLKELKDVRKLGPEKTLKYIQENAQK